MSKEIKIKKRTLFISLAVIVLVGLIVFSYSRTSVYTTNQDADVKELETKFAVLSKANTNSCGGTFNYVASKSPDQRIQGSCCGPMNFHRYTEQIEALKKYSKYEKIPSDPYDVSVESAQELLCYQMNNKSFMMKQQDYLMKADLVAVNVGIGMLMKVWLSI